MGVLTLIVLNPISDIQPEKTQGLDNQRNYNY